MRKIGTSVPEPNPLSATRFRARIDWEVNSTERKFPDKKSMHEWIRFTVNEIYAENPEASVSFQTFID